MKFQMLVCGLVMGHFREIERENRLLTYSVLDTSTLTFRYFKMSATINSHNFLTEIVELRSLKTCDVEVIFLLNSMNTDTVFQRFFTRTEIAFRILVLSKASRKVNSVRLMYYDNIRLQRCYCSTKPSYLFTKSQFLGLHTRKMFSGYPSNLTRFSFPLRYSGMFNSVVIWLLIILKLVKHQSLNHVESCVNC
jgi:hypothetical protein